MPTLSDISSYIVSLIGSVGNFLSTGVMFYIMCIIILGMIIGYFTNLIRR